MRTCDVNGSIKRSKVLFSVISSSDGIVLAAGMVVSTIPAALKDASKVGQRLKGKKSYWTTFPCENVRILGNASKNYERRLNSYLRTGTSLSKFGWEGRGIQVTPDLNSSQVSPMGNANGEVR